MKKLIKIWVLCIACAIPITAVTVYGMINKVEGIILCLIGGIILFILLED